MSILLRAFEFNDLDAFSNEQKVKAIAAVFYFNVDSHAHTHTKRILASRTAKSFEDETIQIQKLTRTYTPTNIAHSSAVRRESCKLRNSNSEF